MEEQPALQIAGKGNALDGLEVLPRFILGPRRPSRSERLQTQDRALPVAGDASRMACPLFQEDGLDLGLEYLVVERRLGRSGRLLNEQADEHQRHTRNCRMHAYLLRRPIIA